MNVRVSDKDVAFPAPGKNVPLAGGDDVPHKE